MAHSFWLPVASKNDTRTLRHFGLGMALLVLVIFELVLPWLTERPSGLWPAVVSLLFLCLALGWPRGLYYPYRAWMAVASIVNAINTRVIMFIAFFGMIVPIGLCMRALGKAPYRRTPDKSATTYWKHRTNPPTAQNLKEPF